jgi:hypothetical protein
MADCTDFGCSALLDHTLSDCGEIATGGIDAALFIKCGITVADPSDDVEITALIVAGDAKVVKGVKIGVDAASPIEIDPVISCAPPKIVNYDRTGTIFDANVNTANVTFYNDILIDRSFGGVIFRECGEGRVTYVDAEIILNGSRIIPNDSNEAQRWEATFKWKSKTEGTIHAEPAGIF